MSESKLNPLARNSRPAKEGVLDLRGRPLQVNDEILLNVNGPIFFRVVDIRPNLDPKAPPNMFHIEVAAAIAWGAVNGQVNPEFIRVRTAEEAGPSNLMKVADEPPAGESKVIE